jgi:hypothetical protein
MGDCSSSPPRAREKERERDWWFLGKGEAREAREAFIGRRRRRKKKPERDGRFSAAA